MMQTSSTPPTIWTRLIEPHASVQSVGERRSARILAGISLVLILITLVFVGWSLTNDPRMALSALPAAGLFAVTYALSRTRWVAPGAWLLVFGLAAINFVLVFFETDPAQIVSDLPFMLIPVVLAALLLNVGGSIAVGAATVIGLLALPLFVPGLALGDYAAQLAGVFLIALLGVATSRFRQGDVETIEKQAEELTHYSESLQDEARALMTTAQVGQAIAGTRELSQLLKQVVNLIIERFPAFYHAQVFLVDDIGEFAELRESTGEAGRTLLERGHKLGVGSQSVIGQVTSAGKALVVRDTDIDPTHRRNELLANTRSEMALPLIASGRVIGALDIQSLNPNAFGESDVRVFQTMADQLAIAIENARLFERAQRDLQEIEMLNRRLTGEGWRSFQQNQRGRTLGFEASQSGVKPLPAGGAEPAKPDQPGEGNTVRMPLVVRGESIGVLDVSPRSGEAPSADVQAVLQAVAERVALALDSSRLSESALRQAEREQVLGRLSAELQATTDLDVILRVAAREASRALGTPRGFVHLVMEYGERAEPAE